MADVERLSLLHNTQLTHWDADTNLLTPTLESRDVQRLWRSVVAGVTAAMILEVYLMIFNVCGRY